MKPTKRNYVYSQTGDGRSAVLPALISLNNPPNPIITPTQAEPLPIDELNNYVVVDVVNRTANKTRGLNIPGVYFSSSSTTSSSSGTSSSSYSSSSSSSSMSSSSSSS